MAIPLWLIHKILKGTGTEKLREKIKNKEIIILTYRN